MLAVFAALITVHPTRAQGVAPADTQFFRIGSGVVDSPSFAVAGIVAAGLSSPPGARPCDRGGSCGVPGMIALAQAIGSPAEAIELLEQRQIDAILVPAGDAYRAYAGKRAEGAKPREPLRTVATVFVEAIHVVVRDGSRFETVDDLKRRHIAAATDDPTAVTFLQLYLNHLGLDGGRKPAPPLAVQAGLQRLADSRIDAVMLIGAPPLPALVEFAHLIPMRLLAVPPAATTRLPYLTDIKLAAGAYAGAEAIELPAVPTQLLVSGNADANRIEAITRALWNEASQKLLAAGPPVARTVKLDRALAGVAVPLHPGAARFYREAGILNATPVGE
ncbi:MAG: TAXI family TRAP transporter solute-binding subunit [Proteobacteria bacterium]|nr:TAXI family TRAP transporter solute-binding subunit [Pseudomonadota bacterium]